MAGDDWAMVLCLLIVCIIQLCSMYSSLPLVETAMASYQRRWRCVDIFLLLSLAPYIHNFLTRFSSRHLHIHSPQPSQSCQHHSLRMDRVHRHDVFIWLNLGWGQLRRFLGLFSLEFRLRFRSTGDILFIHRRSYCSGYDSWAVYFSICRASVSAEGKEPSVVCEINVS